MRNMTITGTLHKIADGDLAGGYYMALAFEDVTAIVTALRAGLDPSDDAMVDVLDVADGNGLFNVVNKNSQVFRVIAETANGYETVAFDLSGLTLEEE